MVSHSLQLISQPREASMVSSYLRMRCPVEEAMARYGRWVGAPELGPPRLVRERDKIDLALADGNWLGLAVYIFASGPWTGDLHITAPEWEAFVDDFQQTLDKYQVPALEQGELRAIVQSTYGDIVVAEA
jgi:hypothetical protein